MTVLHKPGGDQPPGRRPRRAWTVEFPPLAKWSPFPGAVILYELPTGVLSIALWQLYRDLLLWSGLGTNQRSQIFAGGTDERHPAWTADFSSCQHEVQQAIRKVRYVCVAPEMMDAAAMAVACEQIAVWAGEQGYLGTGLVFAELACSLLPDDPDFAFQAGRAARRHAEYDRAVQWFGRTLGLARRSAHRPAYIDALLGWGNLEVQRGRFAKARDVFARAWRAAKKAKIRELGAAAQHNLLSLAAQEYRYEDAYSHALIALKLYKPKDARFLYFAHDMAQLWSWQRYHALALPILEAVAACLTKPGEVLQASANVGRAAGGVRDSERFFQAWDEVSKRAAIVGEYVPAAFINLAEGAYSLGLVSQARDLVQQGFRYAEPRAEEGEIKRGLRLLERLRMSMPAEPTVDASAEMQEIGKNLLRAVSRIKGG